MKKLSIFVILAVAAFLTPTVNAQTRDWGCTPEVQQEMLATVSLYQADIKEYKNSKDVRYLFDAYPKWKMIVANCNKRGIPTLRHGTYRSACEHGWAPAPTNDVQKAIWEEAKKATVTNAPSATPPAK